MAVAVLTPEEAEFYSTQGQVSDPGGYAPRYDELPAEPAALGRITRDLVIHRLEGALFDVPLAPERLHDDAEVRYVDEILRLITERDPRPLTEPRPYAERFVGTCRDFALLHCSFLRHKGIPARIRVGFADYFTGGGFHEDHVVTEYWDAERGWRLADTEVMDGHEVDFDPMDVPRDRFLVAGVAWQRIRAGLDAADSFGVDTPDGRLSGSWYVTGSVQLDLAALNKLEMLQWDIWGLGAASDGDMTDEIFDLYDMASRVADSEVHLEAARTLFAENAGLRTPSTVLSLAPFNGPREVALRGR